MAAHDKSDYTASADDSWGSGPQLHSFDTAEDGVQPAGGGVNGPTGLAFQQGSCAECQG